MPAKTFAAVLVVCLLGRLAAQTPITVIQGTDQVSASRAVINTNFATVATAKVSRFSGAAPPGSIALSIQGDLYYDTTSFHTYVCYSVLCSSSPNWVRVDSINTLPPSTPTFNAGGTTTCNWLTSPVCQVNFGAGDTTLAAINPVSGGVYTLISVEDGTGGRKYTAFPGTFRGASQPDASAGSITIQDFTYDGSLYQGHTAACPNCPPEIILSSTAAPSTPPTGSNFIYVDSSTKTLSQKDDTGTVHTMGGGGGGYTVATVGQGAFYGPFGSLSAYAANNAVPTKSTPKYVQFEQAATRTVGKIVFYVGTLTVNPTHLAVAIYDATCTNKVTNGDATTATITATGRLELAFATRPVLPPGIYHLGATIDTAESVTLLQVSDAGGASSIMANETSNPRFFLGANAATGTGASLAMPAACGARTANLEFPLGWVLLP